MTLQEQLKHEIDLLPEALVFEIMDFLAFLKGQREEEDFLWQKVLEAEEYRRQHPEEIYTVTADEWEKISAALDGEPA